MNKNNTQCSSTRSSQITTKSTDSSIYSCINNISINIRELDTNHYDTEDEDTDSCNSHNTIKSRYFDIIETLNNKFMFRNELRNRTYDAHLSFIKLKYSQIEIEAIKDYYNITNEDMYSDIYDAIVCYELNFDNFKSVYERYIIWKNINNLKPYTKIVKQVLRL